MRQSTISFPDFIETMKPLTRILFLLALFLSGQFSLAQEQSGIMQYQRNRPAVVMIKTEVRAEVNVPGIIVNNRMLDLLLDSVQQLEADSIHLTAPQQLEIVLQAFYRQPRRYFIANFNYFRHTEKVSATGSGFLLSPKGIVVTNCHVVDEGDAYIRRRFIRSAFNYVSENNIRSIEQAWAIRFTEEQRKLLDQTFAEIYSKVVPIELEKMEKKITVTLSRESPSGEPIAVSYEAQILRKGRSMPGKDIAVLKINGTRPFPSMKVSWDEEPPVGAEVYVYGFPNPVNTNEFLSDQTIAEPTLTRGILSGWKQSSQLWPVLQMDAAINHGNSGGPVCNAAGEVIAVTTFGSMDDNIRSLAPGLNFAIPVSVVREFLEKEMIEELSTVSVNWEQALLLIEKKKFKKALDLLIDLRSTDPDHPGLNKMIILCTRQIQQGNDSGGGALSGYFLGLVVMVLFAGLVYWKMK